MVVGFISTHAMTAYQH